jgi:hypothetical protein
MQQHREEQCNTKLVISEPFLTNFGEPSQGKFRESASYEVGLIAPLLVRVSIGAAYTVLSTPR